MHLVAATPACRTGGTLALLIALVSLPGDLPAQPTAPSQNTPPSLHGDSLGDGGPALRARLVTSVGLARDVHGNLYIAERGAHRIRRVDGRTGVITTVAGTGEAGYAGDGSPATAARLTQPDEVVVDRDGNLLIADVFNHRIRKLDTRTGIITTIAGIGEAGFSGDGGPATEARLNGPFGLALDAAGTLFIADAENQRIRRVDARTGHITTVAGNGVWDFAGDGGPALAASLARPHRVLADGDSALLIGDSFNFRIRRVDLRTGIIRTVVGSGERGSGGDGGPAVDAAITHIGALAFTPNGDLLFSSLSEHRIRRVDRRTGIITSVAGSGRWGFDGDGKPARETTLHMPLSLVVEPSGGILFTDLWNGRVRRIDAGSGVITTVVGSAESPRTPAVGWHFHYHRDSIRAMLDTPVQYVVAGGGDVRLTRDVAYRGDGARHGRFDVYAPSAASDPMPAVVVVPGRNDTEVRFKDEGGFRSWGRLIAAAGMVAVVMDHALGTQGRSLARAGDDLAGALDYINRRGGSLGIDASRICVLAFSTAAPLLTRVLSPGASGVECVAAYYPHLDLTPENAAAWLLEPRPAREAYSLAPVLATSRVPTLLVRAGRDQPAVNAPLDSLRVRRSAERRLSFLEHPDGETGFERARADSTTRAVVRATLCYLQRHTRVRATQCDAPDTSTPAPTDSVGDGGPATRAFLDRPTSVGLDADGNLYVSEQRSHRVRRVDATTGVITTVAGTGAAGSSGDGGPASRAEVNYPKIALDRASNLYIGEVNGSRIRRIDARSGRITTIAGTGVQGFSGDGGPAAAAQITRPFGLVVDRDGHLFFTDTEVNRVRRVDARTGIITTVAGTGRYEFSGDGGPATRASLARPHVLALDPDGHLIIGDSFNQRIRRVDRRTGIITTVAGAGFRGAGGDGGPATAATFVYFGGLAYDTAGNLLVSGVGDHRVRRIDARTAVIQPFAGTGRWESSGDGGLALDASFHPALEMVVNARNDVFVADAYGGRVRRIDGRTGIVTTVAGSRAPSPAPGDFHVHFDEAAIARAFDTPVALDLPRASDARVREALDYTGLGDPRRQMDVYLPNVHRGLLPAVVLVQGSAGTDLARLPTRWGAWVSRGRLLAASGVAGVTFSHRLNQERGLEQGSEDLSLALRYVRSNARELGIDAERICIVAFADGAPLLADLVRRPAAGVRCLAVFSPLLELGDAPPPFWMENDPTVRRRFSLATAITNADRPSPMLMLIGAQAAEASVVSARAFAASVRAKALGVTLLEHPDGGSDFDRARPGMETQRLLREWLAFLDRALR